MAGFFVSSLILPWVFTPASFLHNLNAGSGNEITQALGTRLHKACVYNGNEIGLSKGKIIF